MTADGQRAVASSHGSGARGLQAYVNTNDRDKRVRYEEKQQKHNNNNTTRDMHLLEM